MTLRVPAAFSTLRRLVPLGPLLLLALTLFAYRPLFLDALGLPALGDVEQWFFRPDEKTPLLAIGMAGWLLWLRRGRFLALPDASALLASAALLALGTGLFVWAQLTQTAGLLLPSLAANLLAFASATKGLAGLRSVLLPAAVLLLGVPIPGPIRNELVWKLQLWSAGAAAWVLDALGYDVTLSGVRLQRGDYSFTAAASCSGLRGIETVTLIAVAIRELFAASGRRQWLLVLLAPVVGFSLNLLRIVVTIVVTSRVEPEDFPTGSWDHTAEGVAALAVGTVLLYALGRWMAGSRWQPQAGAGAATGGTSTGSRSRLRWHAAAGVLAVLGAVSVAVTPFPPDREPLDWIQLSVTRDGWQGEDLALDTRMAGDVVIGPQALYRRYQRERPGRPPQFVELFVGAEIPGDPASDRVLAPIAVRPGAAWCVEETRRTRLWTLGLDADLAVASRDSEHALVYSWRLRDGGLWRETPRAVLGLDRGPFRRARGRVVVRLVTPLPHDGPVAVDRAKRTLERFIDDFEKDLADL